MELNIGVNCQYSGCNQLDFLPFVCSFCEKTFCLNHRCPADHRCERCSQAPKEFSLYCRSCRKCVTARGDEDPRQVLARHRSSDECTISEDTVRCGMTGCTHGLIFQVCPECKRTYCWKHRAPLDHACVPPVSEQNKSSVPLLSSRPVRSGGAGCRSSGKASKPLSAKGKAMARKMERAKVRLHATGDESIPASQRLPVDLRLENVAPSTGKPLADSTVYVWLDGNNSIGWNIDMLFRRLKIMKRADFCYALYKILEEGESSSLETGNVAGTERDLEELRVPLSFAATGNEVMAPGDRVLLAGSALPTDR
eukprot:GHVU01041747.1.p1 GENE.GHVU01041747.1~~GHVU01041747.1.p1  ORF type:complete len:310 (+),score=23.45 GHVU01041747.1:55-984(+)